MSAAVRIRLMLLLRRNQLGKASGLKDSLGLHCQQVGAVCRLANTDLEKPATSGYRKVAEAEDPRDNCSVSGESVNVDDGPAADEAAFVTAGISLRRQI